MRYYINYAEKVTYDDGSVHKLNSWDDLDLQFLLDQTDVIAIEINEHVMSKYSNGFVQCLNAFLDRYIPGLSEERIADKNFNPQVLKGLAYCDGYYCYEGKYVWAKKDSSVTLYNSKIIDKGIEVSFFVDNNVLIDGKDEIYIYINQKLASKLDIYNNGIQTVIIPTEQIKDNNSIYDIEIICTKDFNPYKLGLSDDNRDLAIAILYIGEVR